VTFYKLNIAATYQGFSHCVSLFLANCLGPGKSTALLSAFRNGLSAFRFPPKCYVSVLPEGGEGAES